jgi:hypothetical protein
LHRSEVSLEKIMKMSKAVGGVLVVSTVVALAVPAFAEESSGSFSLGGSAEADKSGASADTSADGSTAGTATEAEPEAEKPAEPATTGGTSYATAPQAAAADAPPPGGTDHSRVVGTFGIGYMGFRDLGANAFTPALIAPVIGMRYWLDQGLGFDAGIGFATSGGDTEIDTGMGMTTTVDNPGPLVFVLHGGLPLALADSEHFVFEVVPELNLGYATQTVDPGDGNEDSSSVLQVDVGARAGAEIHFGFIDIPQLALQAGVGLRFSMRSRTDEDDVGMTTATTSTSSTAISTGVGDNPWNIFAANVAALYYFDQ